MPEDTENNTHTKDRSIHVFHDSISRSAGNFIDENLSLLKICIPIAGLGTIAFIYRRLHLGTRFTSLESIPREYFEKNVKLRGCLTSRDSTTDTLCIVHKPAVELRKSDVQSNPETSHLQVKLVGTALSEPGREWIDTRLLNREVWFRLLESTSSPAPVILTARLKEIQKSKLSVVWSVVCSHRSPFQCKAEIRTPSDILLHKNGVIRKDVALYLLTKGMAKVEETAEDESHSLIYDKYLKAMRTAEAAAKSKRRGIWYEPVTLQRLKNRFIEFKNRSSPH